MDRNIIWQVSDSEFWVDVLNWFGNIISSNGKAALFHQMEEKDNNRVSLGY
jgi:hypothetical protein